MKKKNFFLGKIALFFCLMLCINVYANVRGRVIVKDSNVLTDTYMPLRCSHVFLYEGTIESINSKERWDETTEYLNSLVNDFGFNCIRVAVWNWQLENAEFKGYSAVNVITQEHVQRYVDFADSAGIYIMLNLHSPYNTPYRKDYQVGFEGEEYSIDTMKNAKIFWSIYGKKYKNNTNVFFELVNEPKVDPEDFLNLVSLYRYLRRIAPKTHIVNWSFNVTSKMNIDILKRYSGKGRKKINYKNASVGFHNYEKNGLSAWQDAQKWQQAGFPVICTEFVSYQHYTLEDSADLPHYLSGMNSAERLGIGWAGWIYEASLQGKYFGKGQVYPSNFLSLAESFGVNTAGIEIDNKPQKKGKKPKVSLELENTIYDQPSITLKVKAKNAVEIFYYSGNVLLGRSKKSPDFSFEWNNALLGDHKISARAISKKGVFYRSAPKHIVVTNNEGIVVDNQGFENGLQGWLGQRAGATISDFEARSGRFSLRYTQPENPNNKAKPLSNNRGVALDITQELSAFGPGKYAVSFWVKSLQTDQTLKLKKLLDKSESVIASPLAKPNEWTLFKDTVDIAWRNKDLMLGVLSIESAERQDFFVDDITIKKVSKIQPLPAEKNF